MCGKSLSRTKLLIFIIIHSMCNVYIYCNPITNSDFNKQIRNFSANEDTNITNVKTLQKEDLGRYANFAPIRNPVLFKEPPDNAISGSNHGRGLHQNYPGHSHEYDEIPHYGYGFDYHVHDTEHHGFDHDHHEDHFHLGHHDGRHHLNHYHKHYGHALAAKTVLWPIAGLALLGAAAALVTNPVLLQLGVISGRRRRRNTEEITGPNLDLEEPVLINHDKLKSNGLSCIMNKRLRHSNFKYAKHEVTKKTLVDKESNKSSKELVN